MNKFKVNDKEYEVKLSTNLLAEAEQVSGVQLWGFDTLSIRVLRALVYAGLKGQHGVKSLEDAGELLDINKGKVTAAITSAYNKYFE